MLHVTTWHSLTLRACPSAFSDGKSPFASNYVIGAQVVWVEVGFA